MTSYRPNLVSPASRPESGEVRRLATELSNWGRWGDDDELGTVNLLTPERRLEALRHARTGVSVSLARRMSPRRAADNPSPLLHLMVRTGLEAPEEGYFSVSDWIGVAFHGFGVTHVDALCHVLWDGKTYNGRPAAEIGAARGAPHNNVERVGQGIVARGVLFDLPRLLGVDWLEPGEAVGPEALDLCERRLDEPVGPGDALVVRLGRDARQIAVDAHDPIAGGFPGLLPSCLPWLHERDLSLLLTDAVSDVMVPGAAPHLMPVHVVCLVAMGLHLVDNAWLEDLASTCSEQERTDFCLTVAPLKIQNASGSPVNPVAIL